MKRRLTVIMTLIALLLPLGAAAQNRTVTPVKPVTSRPVAQPKVKKNKKDGEATKSVRPGSVIEMTDDLGNTVLLDTLSGNEWVDSIALAQPKVIGNIYPLLDAVNVGVDLWPALGRAFGQKQGIGGIWARLSLHNRYFVAVEAGMGMAKTTPRGMNYHYSQPLAPYFKVGLDYNFFYNSNPDYQVYAMARYGISHFSYSLSDVSIDNGYWGTTEHPDFPTQKTTSGYIEIGAGIQVKLWGPISAGWNIKYHRIVHHSREKNGAPWAVPGFGTRAGSLGVSLSLIYTIPLHDPIPEPEKDKKSKK